MTMPSSPPPAPDGDLATITWSLMGPLFTAAMGILMRHAERVAQGHPFSLARLVLEVPTAICMAIIGGAIGDALALPGTARWAIAGVLAYLGPPAILVLVSKITAKPPRPGGTP